MSPPAPVTGRPKLALVLGGGASRGLAHLGVLKILMRERIRPDLIVGTSIGALIGAAFALEVPLENGIRLALRTTWSDLADLTIPRMGFNEGRRLERIIAQAVQDGRFEDAKIPLAVVTTDLETGEEVVLTSGDLIKAIRASCSLPGIFAPIRLDGRLLADGGIKNVVPVSVARRLGGDLVIAVDVVGPLVRPRRIHNILQVILQALTIKGWELANSQALTADVLIRPDLGDVDQMDFGRTREVIRQGEAAAEASLETLRQRLDAGGWGGAWPRMGEAG